ncbi:histidine phosphatase family protein [Halobacillus rhizosphaerae]|uniref:histidine phosphatase family protein n=1 Tax=Halobacillus rhizosphaerae TaxID=3064889 RepID=UPI00398A9161
MTVLGFIRHGSTSWNKEGRAQGSSDIPLDEEGRKEALLLADRLSNESWDYLISSDLVRARETAEIIASQSKGMEVQIDPRLREVSGGKIEGTTEKERISQWGKDWRKIDVGIERQAAVVLRGMESVHDWMNKYENKKVLFVTHGGFIKIILNEMGLLLNADEHIGNTSLSCLRCLGGEYIAETLNCTNHLNEGIKANR